MLVLKKFKACCSSDKTVYIFAVKKFPSHSAKKVDLDPSLGHSFPSNTDICVNKKDPRPASTSCRPEIART